MKKIIILAAIAASTFFASCQKEGSEAKEVKMVHCTFTADIDFEDADPQSKAVLSGLNVAFSPGDVINFVEAKKQNPSTLYPLTTTVGGTSAVFEGDLPDGFPTTTHAHVVFCPSATKVMQANNATSIRFSLPAIQTGVKDNVHKDALLFGATTNKPTPTLNVETMEIKFSILCALLKVKVTRNDIKSIILDSDVDGSRPTGSGNDNAPCLVSDYTNFNLNTDNFSVVSQVATRMDYTVTLQPEDPKTVFEPGYYYFCIPTKSEAQGSRSLGKIRFTYTKTDDSTIVVESKNAFTIASGKIYNLPVSDE
ncbi:MAG: hypothetical protein IJS07_00695 [Bacteroidales bacterium]|nr:hypothetical protein [Bacteroidales bacterium]